MIRVAAVGDVHLAPDVRGRTRPQLAGIGEHADVLLLAGDLTQHGTVPEAEVVAAEFADLGIPVVAVLGNHDYQCDSEEAIIALLAESGMIVLDGTGVELDLPGGRLGVAGGKGFGGGFPHRCASEFGEPEMKAFVRHSRLLAEAIGKALRDLSADFRVALTHYSAFTATRTRVPNTASPPAALRSVMWRCRCWGALMPSTAWASQGRRKEDGVPAESRAYPKATAAACGASEPAACGGPGRALAVLPAEHRARSGRFNAWIRGIQTTVYR